MALDAQQRRIARKIYRVGRRYGANRKEILAALETGWVESGFRNPTMAESDQDSAGWRQERSHYGPESSRRNVGAAARRFFEETRAERGNYRTPGELAQAVQRSAFPEKYRASRDEIMPIYGWLKRTDGDGMGGRPTTQGGRQSDAAGPQAGDPQGLVALTAAVREQQKPMIQSAGVASPQFSAGPAMPAGRQEPVSAGVTPGTSVADLLESMAGQTGQYQQNGVSGPSGGQRGPSGGGAGGSPRIGHDGWYGAKDAAQPAYEVAKHFGIGISSEKRDKKYTATGGISDHWVGSKRNWALDIDTPGLDTAQGAKLAGRVAKRYGVSFRLNSYDSGGTFKVGRRTFKVQILYGGGVGHSDHVHVGIERVL